MVKIMYNSSLKIEIILLIMVFFKILLRWIFIFCTRNTHSHMCYSRIGDQNQPKILLEVCQLKKRWRIHKSGSIHDASNYRPISKISIIAKILENVVTDEVFKKFKRIIIPQQHGFFPKRSTVTNLLSYTETLQNCVDQGGRTDVVYTDFAKAFDKVNHSKLLEKLHGHGIYGSLLKWFESYQKERSQIVQVGEFAPSQLTSRLQLFKVCIWVRFCSQSLLMTLRKFCVTWIFASTLMTWKSLKKY